MDIVNAGCGGAAEACANLVLNGYSDWFLPSRDECEQLRNNKAIIGGFQFAGYWSSTEVNSWFDGANGLYFDNTTYFYSKLDYRNVRAVRYF
jgi:hypothetical protein